jgi:peptidyl-tRNA hydrolase, PTH1 family
VGLFRRSREPEGDPDRWAVVGLGNPGPRYERTRHNVGALVLDELLERTGSRLKSHKSGALVAETRLGGRPALLARPTSFMNESGRPVGALLRYYKLPPSRLVVVHDELDVHFEEVRVKLGGGTAGHNGLNSLVSHLGTKDFVRVRVGVSRPRHGADPADYVLSEFGSAERKELPFVIGRAADAVEAVLADGVERAMNATNTREV